MHWSWWKQRHEKAGRHGLMFHTLSSWVAQHITWTSPLQTLQFSTQKPYRAWCHLNLQNTIANSNELRGLSAKLHYLHFEKGSNGQTIITMQFLGRNYPKVIYGMAIFEFGSIWQKQGKEQGLICKIATLQKSEGQKCKKDLTMMISSSSYPKNIYGMPLFAKGVENPIEFEFKFKLN